MKSTTDKHGKPLKGWTLQQWEDFQRESTRAFARWAFENQAFVIRESYCDVHKQWLQETL